MVQIVFGVHKSRSEECFSSVKTCKGFLSPCIPKSVEKDGFVARVASFNNIDDANAFIYKNHNSFGLYFYVKSMKDVNY